MEMKSSEKGQGLVEFVVGVPLLILLAVGAYLLYLAVVNFYAHVPAPEVSFGTSSVTYETGQMIELTASFELTEAAKKVGGAYAYWETDQHDPNKCFFGIHTPFSWAANTVDGNCPEGPDDEAGIARLIEKLWKSFTTGSTWAELIAMGGKAAGHVLAIIEVAKAYGVTLIP